MFHRECEVHSNIICGHWLEPENASLQVIYDVVSTAELVLVELEVKLVRIGERNPDFPEHFYYLITPVVDMG